VFAREKFCTLVIAIDNFCFYVSFWHFTRTNSSHVDQQIFAKEQSLDLLVCIRVFWKIDRKRSRTVNQNRAKKFDRLTFVFY